MNGADVLFTPHATNRAFSLAGRDLVFGTGSLAEIGAHAQARGLRRVLLVADPQVQAVTAVQDSLAAAGIDAETFSAIAVEPTRAAVEAAGQAARDARVDGFISLGGGSTMDTAKIANLLSSHHLPLDEFLPAPFGAARPLPGPLKPHIACPTTFGTAAETTGIATFEWPERHAKVALTSDYLRPSLGLIDSEALAGLPPLAVAANGFDLLSHAIESLTARRFDSYAAFPDPARRPVTQGANPLAELGCIKAIRLIAAHLAAAVAGDGAALAQLSFAGLLAGTVFANSGNHLPHALSYPVSGHPRGWRAEGYPPGHALVPHGIAVGLSAPAAFRHLGAAAPDRFLRAALALGLEDVAEAEAGSRVADALVLLARRTALPNGLSAIGFGDSDIPLLAEGALAQRRLIDNAPIPLSAAHIEEVVRDSLILWQPERRHA